MVLEIGVVLHAGQGQITLVEYLSRVVLHLLAFAIAGVAVWWCLRAVTPFLETG